jgi:peptidoglycan/LPS O-acetylase OafA/YrhL
MESSAVSDGRPSTPAKTAIGPSPGVEAAADSRQRLDALTGLRWLAAFWVFGYHMQNLGSLPTPFDLPVKLGYLGVTFFFVLSGFVLTWSMRPSVRISTFYTRRFARIWPSHMVALLLAIPVFYTIGPESENSWVKVLSIPILLLSVALLQGFSRDPEILFSGNPAAWTLSVEALFYALHPFLGRPLRRASRRAALIVAVLTLVLAFTYRGLAQFGSGEWASHVPLPLEHLPEFIVGMAVAWAFVKGWRPRFPVWLAWILFGVVIAWLTVAPGLQIRVFSRLAASFSNELATVVCAVLILAIVSGTLRGQRSWLAHRWMVRLGNWSYAFYLVHATVIYAVLNIIGEPRGAGGSNLIWGAGIFIVALAVSAAIHYWVEAPVERSIRGWKDRRDRARAARVGA